MVVAGGFVVVKGRVAVRDVESGGWGCRGRNGDIPLVHKNMSIKLSAIAL